MSRHVRKKSNSRYDHSSRKLSDDQAPPVAPPLTSGCSGKTYDGSDPPCSLLVAGAWRFGTVDSSTLSLTVIPIILLSAENTPNLCPYLCQLISNYFSNEAARRADLIGVPQSESDAQDARRRLQGVVHPREFARAEHERKAHQA